MTLDSGLSGLINDQEKKNLSLGKMMYIPHDRIKLNKFNAERVHHDVELFAQNIKDTGLQQPLVVTKVNNDFILITGHKRWKALGVIFKNNETYTFNGREIEDEMVPCFVNDYENEIKERTAILVSNATEQEDKNEKIRRTIEAEQIYNLVCQAEGKPSGRKREWLAAMTGYSPRSIDNYLLEAQINNELEGGEAFSLEDANNKPSKSEGEKIITKINALTKLLDKFDVNDLLDDEVADFNSSISDLLDIANQFM